MLRVLSVLAHATPELWRVALLLGTGALLIGVTTLTRRRRARRAAQACPRVIPVCSATEPDEHDLSRWALRAAQRRCPASWRGASHEVAILPDGDWIPGSVWLTAYCPPCGERFGLMPPALRREIIRRQQDAVVVSDAMPSASQSTSHPLAAP